MNVQSDEGRSRKHSLFLSRLVSENLKGKAYLQENLKELCKHRRWKLWAEGTASSLRSVKKCISWITLELLPNQSFSSRYYQATVVQTDITVGKGAGKVKFRATKRFFYFIIWEMWEDTLFNINMQNCKRLKTMPWVYLFP